MKDSPLINKIKQDSILYINQEVKVNYFIVEKKNWKVENLKDCLLEETLKDIYGTPNPINNIDDKLSWKFTSTSNFSVTTETWANNTYIKHHPKAKFINSLQKLNLRPKLKFLLGN